MAAKTILVTGDQSPDYDIYLHSDEDNPRPGSPPTIVRASIGGAGLAARVLDAASRIKGETASSFTAHFLPYAQDSPKYVTALWQPCSPGILLKNTAKVWRTRRSISLGEVIHKGTLPQPEVLQVAVPEKNGISADVLLLEDDGAGFRFRPQSEISELLRKEQSQLPAWIVFKTCAPVCYGDIWWTLSGSQILADRLIVIVPINHLRLSSAIRVSHGISWERTAEDLARELAGSPELAGLRRAKHVIVTMHGEGALWMERTSDVSQPFKFWLFFDPANMETEWSRRIGAEGEAYGYNCCFAASIAAHCASSLNENPETWLRRGIRCGLWSMRVLRVVGHGFTSDKNPGFPLSHLGQLISAGTPEPLSTMDPTHVDWKKLGSFGESEIPLSKIGAKSWHILEATDRPIHDQPLYGMARRVSLIGTKALANMPYSRFGKLFTADRDEIEALRNLKLLIQEYKADQKEVKPLSLAVFGPPGAGKSFGIKQIAGEVLEEKTPCLEFNLSQFSDPDDLIGAFHQVRDKVLEGHLPVVFWDEFDSENYKWLQYLLAPMQDGKFQEGQLTHPIGRCVFVFAGATSYTFKDFGPPANAERSAHDDFILKKGPDFISRLHGSLDVLGPNPRQKRVGSGWEDDPSDRCFPVRRAILLRSMLGLMSEKRSGDRLDMDHGLLVALLEVGHYLYGSRSFEKIVISLRQGSGQGYRCSSLPTNESLRIAFKEDLSEFTNLLKEFQQFQAYSDKLAPAIHQFYLDLCRKNGWPIKYDMPYDKLSEAIKMDNVAASMRIPWILGLAGLALVRSDHWSNDDIEIASGAIDYHLELLAEEEHNLWMEDKLRGGWRPAKKRNDDALEHDCLLSFDKLEEKQKAKDRDAVKNFPKIAQMAGFKIVIRRRRGPDESGEATSSV